MEASSIVSIPILVVVSTPGYDPCDPIVFDPRLSPLSSVHPPPKSIPWGAWWGLERKGTLPPARQMRPCGYWRAPS